MATKIADRQLLTAPGGGAASDLLSPLTGAEVSVTTTTTLTLFGRLHVCTGTSANYTVTLPAASGNAGKMIGVRMASTLTKLVTIDAGTGVLIDGQQTRILWAQETATLMSDGTGWVKLNGKSRAMFCRLRLSAATATAQGISTATMTVVQHDAADDPTGLMANLTTWRITAQRPGTYQIIPATNFNFGFTASRVLTRAIINGGSDYGGEVGVGNSSSFAAVTWPMTFMLSATDFVTHAAYQTSGGTQQLYGSSLNFLSILETPAW